MVEILHEQLPILPVMNVKKNGFETFSVQILIGKHEGISGLVVLLEMISVNFTIDFLLIPNLKSLSSCSLYQKRSPFPLSTSQPTWLR